MIKETVHIKVLGCGHSAGTPLPGNEWGACNPTHPYNRRTRASLYVCGENGAFIVDTGPDFRNQVNENNIKEIDAVLYTHCHADHVNGIDDLRHWVKYRKRENFPIYMSAETWEFMRIRFDYLLEKAPDDFYPLLFRPFIFDDLFLYRLVDIAKVPVFLFEQDHKTCTSLGVRIGNLAYSTDMLSLDQRSIDLLRGIDIWIVDAASYKWTPYVHAGLNEIYMLNEQIGARQVYLTHMPPTMDYETLLRDLPSVYFPDYDGMTFEIAVEKDGR